MTSVPKTLGKYQILGPLGQGGMGEVYKAYQPDLRRTVAIKTLLAGEHASPDSLERFLREARVAAQLVHPNIVQIYDIGIEGRLRYIVMEHVEGRSLKGLLAERGRLDAPTALRIARSVARALQFAHERGVIHRDIKPANILLDRRGRVRLLDFGLAKSLTESGAPTAGGAMIGTPCYMSPEQAFAAPEEVDARTDLYSLGAVLYEMLTGRPPFEGATVLAILRKIEEEDPAPPGVSPEIDALVLKALAKDPARRFRNAAEMAEALGACLAGVGEGEPSAGRLAPDEAGPPAAVTVRSPRRVLRASAAALALLLAGVVVWAAWPGPAAPPAPPAPAPPPPPDPAAELHALLARRHDVLSAELNRFRDDPQLCRIIARHFVDRGQYSRALDYLKGYERAIGELASARGLQRFVSPVLFRLSIPQPRDLKGSEAFLMAALARHLEGKQDAARQKLRSAVDNGARSADVLLVRAHIDLWDAFPDPTSEASKALLEELRRDLAREDEPFLIPLRALAADLAGDAAGARDLANLLSRRAPSAAETFLLSSILYLRAGRVDLALDELKEAHRMDPKNLEISIHQAYLRWLEVIGNPDVEKLYSEEDPAFDLEKMYADEMRQILDDRLRHDHYPAALFLRAVLHAFESRWELAERDLATLSRRVGPFLGQATAHHPLLAAFLGAAGSRDALLEAAADLQEHLGRTEAARATAQAVEGRDLPEGERAALRRRNHLRLARLWRSDEARALAHVEEALKWGAGPEEVRQDEGLGDLRRRPAFEELLRRHER
jgi:serine/threonine-protein kinase